MLQLDNISSTVCFSILSKWSLSDLRMFEISDKNFLFCLSISEILFVIKFGVLSVTKKHCSTSLVQKAESQAQIPQKSNLGATPQLTRKTTANCLFRNLRY
jgi:hypothetical protein